jgi:hypothetical protein
MLKSQHPHYTFETGRRRRTDLSSVRALILETGFEDYCYVIGPIFRVHLRPTIYIIWRTYF